MPAICRERIAVGTILSEIARICSPNPSRILSQTASVASGVTSLFAGPVPPVVTTRQHFSTSHNSLSVDSINGCSSGIIFATVSKLHESISCKRLLIAGPPGSELQHSSKGKVTFISEGFADRQYLDNGTLVPRNLPNAFIHDPIAAALQAQKLVQTMGIQTLCIHGDQPDAFHFVKKLRCQLEKLGIEIRAFS